MTILFLLLFLLSYFGYYFEIYKRFKINYLIIAPLIVISLSIILFFAGLLNILNITSILLYILGFIFLLINHRFIIKIIKGNFKNIDLRFILFILFIIISVLVTLNYKLDHYDNFSHWALIVKNMLIDNALPNFENAVIGFKAYQPGTACYIYYIARFIGRSDGVMMFAQAFMFFSLLMPIYYVCKGKYKNYFTIIATFLIIFMSVNVVLFTELLVDNILSISAILSIIAFYNHRKNIDKLFIILLILSIYSFIVKNSGVIFVAINCLLVLYAGFKNKETLKGLKYSIIIGFSFLFTYLIWSSHVKMVYGDSGLMSAHALSSYNIINHLRMLGIDNLIKFIVFYFNNFFNLFENKPSLIMFISNLIMISFLVLYKKDRKFILESIIISNFIFCFYYFVLGIMYVVSMTSVGAFGLAGFDRYMFTAVYVILTIVFLTFISINKQSSQKKLVTIYMLMFIILILSYISIFNMKNIKRLIGFNWYKDSIYEKLDNSISNYNFDNEEKIDVIYIYSPKFDDSESGYLFYLSKYVLNKENVIIAETIEEIKVYENTFIICLEKDNKINDFTKVLNFDEVSKNIYKSS